MHAYLTSMSTFERRSQRNFTRRILRLTKWPHVPHFRREYRLPLKKYSTFHKTPKYIKPGVLTLMDSVPLLFLTTQPQVGYHVSSFSRSEIHSSLTFCSIFSKLNHEYDPSHHRHVVWIVQACFRWLIIFIVLFCAYVFSCVVRSFCTCLNFQQFFKTMWYM
jgi:hypothetical protein